MIRLIEIANHRYLITYAYYTTFKLFKINLKDTKAEAFMLGSRPSQYTLHVIN